MKLAIQIFGTIIILLGALLLVNPAYLFSFLENNGEKTMVYISAIAARLILGIILIKSAKESKNPTAIKILGGIAILAALIFILIGPQSFNNLINIVISIFTPYGRIAGLVSMVFGGFLIYTFSGGVNGTSPIE